MVKHTNKWLLNLIALVTAMAAPYTTAYASAPSIDKIKIKQQTRVRQLNSISKSQSVIFYDFFEEGSLRGGAINADTNNRLHQVSALPIDQLPYNVTTILDNGLGNNRIDIVIIGDGYIEGELDLYANNVANIVTNFFNQTPLEEYKSFFNVHRVDVISTDSGVDNDPTQGISKNTALDMGYWCSGIERLLCVNVSKAIAAASNATNVDQILAVANSSKYGGAGYSGSGLGTVAGNNASAVEVAIHEFGHSFAGLADEYTYGQSETYLGLEFAQANVSIYEKSEMMAENRKWARWMDVAEVDTFEGGNYHVYGVYRPTNNSKMRALNQPFGPVNVEQFLIKMYQAVSPIDSATDSGTYDNGTVLSAHPIQPTDHNLEIQWWVDDELIDNDGATQFDTSELSNDTDHTVAVRIRETSDWVRDEEARNLWMTEERLWTVLATNIDTQADLSLTLNSINLFGWASPFRFWINSAEGQVNYELTITNTGPQTSENVTVVDTLPIIATTASYSTSQGNCDVASIPTCQLGNLAANQSAIINVVATVNSAFRDQFSASVNSDTPDPDNVNNNAEKTLGGGVGWGFTGMLALLWRRSRYQNK